MTSIASPDRPIGFGRKRISILSSLGGFLLCVLSAQGGTNVYLTEVPDYEWYVGCFGTASGNLMGFWDRHGFPNMYTGPTSAGLAPLNSFGSNSGIRSLWATEAGIDGRPSDKPGHVDDYYVSYASTEPDPYVTRGRSEHQPDCLGDFIGLSQRKWKDLDGECDGNIDAYSFVYWNASGERRINYTPGPDAGLPAVDIQSGLQAWTTYRGYTADVFTQLANVNPTVPPGKGFTYADLKAEIDAGYPVLMFLQDYSVKSRPLDGLSRANPLIHGVLAYGYFIDDSGNEYVRFRTSFSGGDSNFAKWKSEGWWGPSLPLRGAIGYHPQPLITGVEVSDGQITIQWHGPASELYNLATGATTKLHWYVIERAKSVADSDFVPVTDPTTDTKVTFSIADHEVAFFRLKLLLPPDAAQ